MHRKFGKVWHVVFKICKQTYKHTRLEMWMVYTFGKWRAIIIFSLNWRASTYIWERVLPLSIGGGVSQIFFDFWMENGAFWCLLSAIFAHCSNLQLHLLLCFISYVFLPSTRGGVWEGTVALYVYVPPPQKIFWHLSRKWRVLVHSECYFYVKLFSVIKHKFTFKVTYRTGGSRKKNIFKGAGGLAPHHLESTTAEQNYYRTSYINQ